MNKIMLSCKEATENIEKKSEKKQSPTERMQLFMHTSFCNACSTYQKQSRQLDKALKLEGMLRYSGKEVPPRQLPASVKIKILKKLKD